MLGMPGRDVPLQVDVLDGRRLPGTQHDRLQLLEKAQRLLERGAGVVPVERGLEIPHRPGVHPPELAQAADDVRVVQRVLAPQLLAHLEGEGDLLAGERVARREGREAGRDCRRGRGAAGPRRRRRPAVSAARSSWSASRRPPSPSRSASS